MKYLALIYQAQGAFDHYSEEAMAEVYEAHYRLQDKSRAEGSFAGADKLEPVDKAKTLKRENGKLLVTDGPFAESKEVLVGFYLFDCESMEKALELAADIPMESSSKIEVRPVAAHIE